MFSFYSPHSKHQSFFHFSPHSFNSQQEGSGLQPQSGQIQQNCQKISGFIIMHSDKVQQGENTTAEHKIFERAYNRKFVNEAVSELVEKRRIVASQLKVKQTSSELEQNSGTRNSFKGKSKSVGSLLPQIKEIEAIAKSEKQTKTKSLSNSLSKLQIYLTQKNIKRSQQLNILFLTQSNYVIPDRVINQKFNNFIAINQDNKPKNLRALLSLTGGFEVSEEVKLNKIGKQKQELTEIVKTMIEQHHAQEDYKQPQSEKQSEHEEQESEKQPERGGASKDINWVLKECKKYDKKFRLKKKKNASKNKKPKKLA